MSLKTHGDDVLALLDHGLRYSPLEVSIETTVHKYRPERRRWAHLEQHLYPYRQQPPASHSTPHFPFLRDTACNIFR